MEKRKLGNSGLEISPLMLGGNVFGWSATEKTSFQLLDAFISAGFNAVDTADVYSRWAQGNKGGESERIIGKWLKKSGKRSQVVIATKVGKEMEKDKKGLSRQYILSAAEDSLKRLQTDYIDLYQSHEDDSRTPLDETLEAFQTLISQGKARAIGASNYSARRLKESLETSETNQIARYESLQPLYNLFDRNDFERELRAVCIENGLGVITFYSLARGFLSGKYRSENDLYKSVRGEGIRKFLNHRGMRIISALDEVSQAYQTTPAAIALAWLMGRIGVTSAIASATSLDQLQELMSSAEIKLDSAAIEKLDTASQYPNSTQNSPAN
ncbi:MAG TPA: aldo/keto reductase [Puia sp.]|nr:aldo/keto reductase [Puia sp.]